MTAPLVITHPASHLHRPPGHPEGPGRIEAIEAALADRAFDGVQRLQLAAGPDPVAMAGAARELASRVHDPEYVDAIFRVAVALGSEGPGGWLDADTYVGPGSMDAVCAALLSAQEAVRAVLEQRARTAFSLCRPPGHHATRAQAMGFCFFNNAAAAAQVARDAGVERVAVVDFDVHHGNGTQDIFYDRQDVLYVSTHQWPLYPGTGAADERGQGEGTGYTLNLPLPAGTGDPGYAEVFDSVVIPRLEAFRPGILVVSAGFDAHEDDPLAQMGVTTGGFGALAVRLLDVAERLCEGRSAWILEGGYNLEALASSVATCVNAARREA